MDTSAEKRKPGRPRKSPQAPLQNPVLKRGRGRPPKNATTPPVTSSGVVVEPGKRKPGRPKRNSISKVNGGVMKRGRPKRLPLVTRSTGRRKRGRPKSSNPAAQYVSVNGGGGDSDGHRPLSKGRGRPPKSRVKHADGHRPLSKGRGRPPKRKVNMNFLAWLNSLGGPRTAALVTDPLQLVAYKELKLKYEHLQTKAKEVVVGVSPYINPENEVFRALQELEKLVGTDVNVQS